MKTKFLVLSPNTNFQMISLELSDDAEALALAEHIAESTGRIVTVRRADGEIIEKVGPSPRN